MDLAIGGIQPIRLGAGIVSYHRNGVVRTVRATSATIFGLIVLVYFKVDDKEVCAIFPLANLVEHEWEATT